MGEIEDMEREGLKHKINRWRNDIRRLSWFVIGIALFILLIGMLGVIDGPIPYPRIHIFASSIWDIHSSIDSEFVGIGVTVLIIDTGLRLQAIRDTKRRLIREMTGSDNGLARRAVDELKEANWLYDGSLRRAYLGGANLREVDLTDAALQEAVLIEANLQEAYLVRAHLQKVHLWYAKLQKVRLGQAKLQNADLTKTKLQSAVLLGTQVHGTILSGVELQGSRFTTCKQLSEAKSLRDATLPDGTKLPDDDSWREAFEAWCETAPVNEQGYIIPAEVDKSE